VRLREQFLEELARSLDFWVGETTAALTDPQQDLRWTDDAEAFKRIQQPAKQAGLAPKDLETVLRECFRGFAVSALTILDGGTELAVHGRVRLVDEGGVPLGEGLHDLFVEHLLDTGRMR